MLSHGEPAGVALEIDYLQAPRLSGLRARQVAMGGREDLLDLLLCRFDKDHEKTTQSAEAWVLWQNGQVVLDGLA